MTPTILGRFNFEECSPYNRKALPNFIPTEPRRLLACDRLENSRDACFPPAWRVSRISDWGGASIVFRRRNGNRLAFETVDRLRNSRKMRVLQSLKAAGCVLKTIDFDIHRLDCRQQDLRKWRMIRRIKSQMLS